MACALSLSLLCPRQTLLISYDILFYELGLGSKSIWTTVSMDGYDETYLPCILKQPKYSRGPREHWNLNKVKLSFMKQTFKGKREWRTLRFYCLSAPLLWESRHSVPMEVLGEGKVIEEMLMSKPLFQPLCKYI